MRTRRGTRRKAKKLWPLYKRMQDVLRIRKSFECMIHVNFAARVTGLIYVKQVYCSKHASLYKEVIRGTLKYKNIKGTV